MLKDFWRSYCEDGTATQYEEAREKQQPIRDETGKGILVINQLNVQILLYNKFIIRLYMFRAICAHHQEVKIVLYSIWYHHTL